MYTRENKNGIPIYPLRCTRSGNCTVHACLHHTLNHQRNRLANIAFERGKRKKKTKRRYKNKNNARNRLMHHTNFVDGIPMTCIENQWFPFDNIRLDRGITDWNNLLPYKGNFRIYRSCRRAAVAVCAFGLWFLSKRPSSSIPTEHGRRGKLLMERAADEKQLNCAIPSNNSNYNNYFLTRRSIA